MRNEDQRDVPRRTQVEGEWHRDLGVMMIIGVEDFSEKGETLDACLQI